MATDHISNRWKTEEKEWHCKSPGCVTHAYVNQPLIKFIRHVATLMYKLIICKTYPTSFSYSFNIPGLYKLFLHISKVKGPQCTKGIVPTRTWVTRCWTISCNTVVLSVASIATLYVHNIIIATNSVVAPCRCSSG